MRFAKKEIERQNYSHVWFITDEKETHAIKRSMVKGKEVNKGLTALIRRESKTDREKWKIREAPNSLT